ncbi:hypothetical protein [Cryobacterium sp. AP23]
MPERLDPRPLIGALVEGLRKRRLSGTEPADVPTRVVLFGLPLIVGGLVFGFGLTFTQADQLLAACALLAGALLTGFAQVASWRERILTRYRRVDEIDVRSLNEAAAHILVSLLVSVLAAIAVFILANLNLQCPTVAVDLWARALSGLSATCLSYVAISLLIVVNLLWDALQNEQRETQREAASDQ